MNKTLTEIIITSNKCDSKFRILRLSWLGDAVIAPTHIFLYAEDDSKRSRNVSFFKKLLNRFKIRQIYHRF